MLPGATSKSTLRRTSSFPYAFLRPCTRIAGPAIDWAVMVICLLREAVPGDCAEAPPEGWRVDPASRSSPFRPWHPDRRWIRRIAAMTDLLAPSPVGREPAILIAVGEPLTRRFLRLTGQKSTNPPASPGGRREAGETAEECARRELREEGGMAETWRSLGSYAMTLGSTARVHLFEARRLSVGPQELTPTEQDFKLSWWSMGDAIDAVAQGRFLLPAGPLALLLADSRVRVGDHRED
ncbi:NUDIX domain-containing protein [Streptomyces violaceusniger]|uniref:NUDIX domain-containing protein n=1 Tax=Streptomyces violaceusniger TaxID=68280 RepID=UPI003F49D59D